jgi:hypothetical protein
MFSALGNWFNLNPLSVLSSCNPQFPAVDLSWSSNSALALKSPSGISVSFFGHLVKAVSSFSWKLSLICLLFSFLGAHIEPRLLNLPQTFKVQSLWLIGLESSTECLILDSTMNPHPNLC